MLQVLVDWVENGPRPGDLDVVEQQPALPITSTARCRCASGRPGRITRQAIPKSRGEFRVCAVRQLGRLIGLGAAGLL
jgi:hypothetical protein